MNLRKSNRVNGNHVQLWSKTVTYGDSDQLAFIVTLNDKTVFDSYENFVSGHMAKTVALNVFFGLSHSLVDDTNF